MLATSDGNGFDRRIYGEWHARRALTRDRRALRIVDLVAAEHQVTRAELLSRNRRSRKVVVARQLAMYLVHTTLGLKYEDVGALFGRDRTTVSYACARTEDRREDKSPFERRVAAIEVMLGEETNHG